MRIIIAAGAEYLLTAGEAQAVSFRFENFSTLEKMDAGLKAALPAGMAREEVRKLMAAAGARRRTDPSDPRSEKYIYDVAPDWRWNISADYTGTGMLAELYVNGSPIYGAPSLPDLSLKPKAAFFTASMRGVPYIVLDEDGNSASTHDQWIFGGGPNNTPAEKEGRAVVYGNIPLFRSVFALENADGPGDRIAARHYVRLPQKSKGMKEIYAKLMSWGGSFRTPGQPPGRQVARLPYGTPGIDAKAIHAAALKAMGYTPGGQPLN